MKSLIVLTITVTAILLQSGCASDGWISLFDGNTLKGWQPSENQNSWKVEEGALVTNGPRSHLFYVGDGLINTFKNFEFMADVKTKPASNSGIYFHTTYQNSGWPDEGYECQVINSYPKVEPGEYIERKMTGSLYGIRNVWKSPVADDEWFRYHIIVQGKTIRISINNQLMVDYTEPENIIRDENLKGRVLSSGTFALQCHDPKSIVYYKNIKVKPLADDLPSPGVAVEDPAYDARLIALASKNFPLIDLHVHLKGGLTLEQALEHSRIYGFTYGIAINCGKQMGFESDDSIQAFLNTYPKPTHTFLAMQAEGREWLDMFSKDIIDKFDYVFTDAMTWTNDDGKRMRLWIKEETEIGDVQDFMNQLVDRIERILRNEPIQIYVNSTYLPAEIRERYDELWTEQRMDRVVKALSDNNIALEINARLKLPSAAFIKKAKAAGVKFTFGTNNGGPNDLGRLEYCVKMAEECGLTPDDMWMPQLHRK
jgi:hypothetical protein